MNLKDYFRELFFRVYKKFLDGDIFSVQGIVDIYKNNKHIIQKRKTITRDGFRTIGYAFAGIPRNTNLTSDTYMQVVNENYVILYHNEIRDYWYPIISHFNIGSGDTPENFDNSFLENPILQEPKPFDTLYLVVNKVQRKFSIKAEGSIFIPSNMENPTIIKEFGVFSIYWDSSNSRYVYRLFDRATFNPLSAYHNDILSFVFTVEFRAL